MYPPIGAAMTTVGMDDIGVYITRRQNTVAQYIATLPIMDLYLAVDRKTGLCLSRRWWEHTDLDILGIRAWRAAAEGRRRRGRRNRGERESRVGKDGGRGLILLGEPETIGPRSDG